MRDKKRLLKLAAVSLAVCLATPNVVAPVGTTKVYAETETETSNGESFPLLDAAAKNEKVAMAVEFKEGNQTFNGSRVEDFSEHAEAIHGVSAGSIIIRFKVDSTNDGGVLLGVRDKSQSGLNPENTGQSLGAISVRSNNSKYWFTFHHDRASLGKSLADGEWHTAVLSSNATKTLRLTIDGTELWHSTGANAGGLFSKQAKLDQVSIGGLIDGSGNIASGFKGSISHVIVTAQDISDTEAKSISYEGWSAKPDIPAVGGDFQNLFNNGTDQGDNSWVITGGDAVKGGYDQTEGRRNYGEHFEEYIRFSTSASRLATRQRYVFNAGRKNYSIAEVVAEYDTLVIPFGPKAAAYMVGVEDYSKGTDTETLAIFKTNLKSFIEKSVNLKADKGGYAVIQTPFATNNNEDNQKIEAYVKVVKEVITECAADPVVAAKIQLVDHYAMTSAEGSTFKTSCLNADNTLNANGHLEIGRQFARIVKGTDSNFPAGGVNVNALDERRVEAPSEYLKVLPTVTGAASSLSVSIPTEDSIKEITEWKYILTIGDTIVEGNASGNNFTINGLVADADYVLKIRSKDGEKQITTVQGKIKAGNTAVQYKQTLDEKQQAIADKMAADDSLTWIFMGDSITHSSKCTYGYKGVAQLFRDFIQDGLGREKDMIINTAVGNANTPDTVRPATLEQRIGKFTPDIVSIQLGTNDAVREASFEGGPAREITSTEDYIKNIEIIIDKIEEKNPDAIVILRTPIPTFDPPHEQVIPDYVSALKELAEERGCLYIDQYTEWRKQMDPYSWLSTRNAWGYLFDDIVHPNAIGHTVLRDMFIKACGLWNEDNPVTNLNYKMQITEEQVSNVVPAVHSGADKMVVPVEELKKISNLQLGEVEVKATDEETGQSYTTSVDAGESQVVLKNLPEGLYKVQVSSYLTNTAKRVTFAETEVNVNKNAPVVIDARLENENTRNLSPEAVVGEFAVGVLAPEGDYTYTLVSGEGSTDNSKFEIKNNQLVIKEALTEGQTYSIRVKVQVGDVSEEDVYEIYAVGSGLLIDKSDMTIVSGTGKDLSQESVASKVFGLEEGTIIVDFTSTGGDGIRSLFSISNKTNTNEDKNRHLHLYVTPDGTIGVEIRNHDQYKFTTSAGAIKITENGTNVKNIIALKADKANKQYKIFANGQLVKTVDNSSFRFADIVNGADTISVGGTNRGGAMSYNFGGTVHNLKVYSVPLSDDEIIAATGGETGEEPGDTSVAVTGVSLNKNTLALTVGGNETLTATVTPTNATNRNVTWTSSDSAVATVVNGKVTAVKAGTATITVTTADGNKTATCMVTVTESSTGGDDNTGDSGDDQTQQEVAAAKAALETVINEADEKEESEYTEASWAIFAEALKAAKEVFADEEATKEALEAAKEALEAAKEALVQDGDDNTGDSGEGGDDNTGDGGDEVQHTPATQWSKDAMNHWHACTVADCDEKHDLAEHTWDAGTVSKVPTATEKGEKTFTCSVCGQIKKEDVPATGGSQGGQQPGGNNNQGGTSGGQQQGTQKEVQAAKEALNAALKDAASKKESAYTKESFSAFRIALQEVQVAFNNPNATKAELTQAQQKLQMAIQALKAVETGEEQKSDQPQESTQKGTPFKDAKGIYTFKIKSDTEAIFTGVAKSIKTVKIANTVTYAGKTLKVTAIAPKALKGDKIVTKVTVGKNVKEIGASAFEGCEKLTSISLGTNTTKIGNKALKGCKSLKKVKVPKKVANLGKSVFEGCAKLSNITIQATGLKKVGKNTFKGISGKAKIKVPKKNLAKYKKLLKNKGQNKKVSIR